MTMNFNMPENHQLSDQQCVDPRLLTGSGLQFDDPNYDYHVHAMTHGITPEQLQLSLFPETSPSIPPEKQEPVQESQCYPTQPSGSSLELPTMDELGRPRLTLETAPSIQGTAPQIQEQATSRTPNTPEIRIVEPAFPHPEQSAVQGARQTSRGRRNSSPTGLRKQSSTRGRSRQRARVTSLSHHVNPSTGLLSPMAMPYTTQNFIINNSYHVGDRSGHHVGDHSVLSEFGLNFDLFSQTPSSPGPGSTISLNSNYVVNGDGRLMCNEEDCPETQAGKFFDTPNALRKHQRKHIPEKDRPHGCHSCERRFLYPKDRNRHQQTHQPITVTCQICFKLVSRADNLVRHLSRVHGVTTPTPSRGRSRKASNADGGAAFSTTRGPGCWTGPPRGSGGGPPSPPAPDSAASFSQYSLSRPGSPSTPCPMGESGFESQSQQWMASASFGMQFPIFDDSWVPQSPADAPPMERSRSDFN